MRAGQAIELTSICVSLQGTAVYLASDADSSYVTGAIINVTGGQPHIA